MGDTVTGFGLVLEALAELAIAPAPSATSDVTLGDEPVVWFGTGQAARWTSLLDPGGESGPAGRSSDGRGVPLPGTERVARLAALDAVHGDERLLRVGWLWVVGRRNDRDGKKVVLPLISAPVRVMDSGTDGLARSVLRTALAAPTRVGGGPDRVASPQQGSGGVALVAVRAGDVMVAGSEREPHAAAELARSIDPRWGRLSADPSLNEIEARPGLRAWVRAAADAAGFGEAQLIGGSPNLTIEPPGDRLAIVAGIGLYVSRQAVSGGMQPALRRWSTQPGTEHTAMARITLPPVDDSAEKSIADDEPVRSTLTLTVAQADAVRSARTAHITVVSGPPGTGKTHVVAAIALDAVARGGTVLVATRSDPATAAVARAFARHAGPPPVRFGDIEDPTSIADALSAMVSNRPDARTLDAARQADKAAEAQIHHIEAEILTALAREALAEAADEWADRLPGLERTVPALASVDLDLPSLADDLERARSTGDGWWDRWRSRGAERRLRACLGVDRSVPLPLLADAVTAAAARRADASLHATGGTTLADQWRALTIADVAGRKALGHRLTLEAAERAAADRQNWFAVESLATAIRASRARRRTFLATVDGERVIDALPLWLGTLADVEDLLPAHPGLFDLVILDEGSQIELPAAAPALLRGQRAVVVGDRHQLRHVSFVADQAVDEALGARGLGHLRAALDVRRVSTFDAAAARAPSITLDEHFRSVPHLISFSARRIYGGRVAVATRNPGNDAYDAVEVVAVNGSRRPGGQNPAEVHEVTRLLRQALDGGVTSIGVLSPFRAQADALERMVLAELPLQRLHEIDLLVGTAHAFQGAERDVVIASLAIGDDDRQALRFLEDPNLFNVLVTRARHRFVLVHSLTDPGRGLVAEYLAQADHPPVAPDELLDDPWTQAIAARLNDLGVPNRTGYRVGHHLLDLVVGSPDRYIAIESRVHPGGPGAHLARRRTLTALGWAVADAYPTAYSDDPVAAALAISHLGVPEAT